MVFKSNLGQITKQLLTKKVMAKDFFPAITL